MTDRKYLLAVLADGRSHTLAEILTRSMNERGCGMTVHSRVADLRKHGYVIRHDTVPGAERGHAHTYRLLASPGPGPTHSPAQTIVVGCAPSPGSGNASGQLSIEEAA